MVQSKTEEDVKMEDVYVINKTMNLLDNKADWVLCEEYNCYCLENVLYTAAPKSKKFQRLSIFVPAAYMCAGEIIDGRCGRYTSATAPIIFENNAAGYAEMEHTKLGGSRNYARQYLQNGMVYVTCGCRGRQTQAENKLYIGKSPASLVDFKTAIRFLRHNRYALPGNMEYMISVGWSAGGAMSALIGCTGNSLVFEKMLLENGAFMEESDAVYAAQVYCPIIDLEHADLAYEWQYRKDYSYEISPFKPKEILSDFQRALSEKFSNRFIQYFNEMQLRDPETKEILWIGKDGRSGNAYEYLMKCLEKSATAYMKRVEQGEIPAQCSVEDYLDGNYFYKVPDFSQISKKENENVSNGDNHLITYEGHGFRVEIPEVPMKEIQGNSKRNFLSWDGKQAQISCLDDYVMEQKGRMKACPSFDFLDNTSGENQVFGDEKTNYMHFNPMTADVIEELKEEFPIEYNKYYAVFAKVKEDERLAQRCALINPFSYIGKKTDCHIARYFRINVGANDADTSFMVSLMLALKLDMLETTDVQYNLYWEQPHCEADYPGDVCAWIDLVVAKNF